MWSAAKLVQSQKSARLMCIDGRNRCEPPRVLSVSLQLGQSRFAGKAAGVDRYRALYAVTIWELIMIWVLGASVAVTVAMVAALAIIFWVNRKLD